MSKKKDILEEEIVFEKVESKSIDKPNFLEKFLTEKNKKNLPYYIGGAIVLIAAIGYYFYNQRVTKNAEAQEQMFRAVYYFEQDSVNKAIVGDGQFPGLEMIVDDYGSTKAGNLAKYYLGLAYMRSGRIDEGVDQIEDFSKDENLVSAASYSALAYASEDQGDFEKAAELFVEAAELQENSATSPVYLMSAGRNYELANNKESAHDVYQKIKINFPKSQEASIIDKYLARTE